MPDLDHPPIIEVRDLRAGFRSASTSPPSTAPGPHEPARHRPRQPAPAPVSSLLASVSIALLLAVTSLREQAHRQSTRVGLGVDAVLGPKGSQWDGDYRDDGIDVAKPWTEWSLDGSVRNDSSDR